MSSIIAAYGGSLGLAGMYRTGSITLADNQPATLGVDVNGNLLVNVAAGGTSGVQYTDANAAATHPVGTGIIFNNGGTYNFVSAAQPLPVTGSFSLTNPSTGSAVPATANYIAANKAGNLTGLLVGSQTTANSLAVVLASDQVSIPVAATLSAETTKVIGTVNVATSQSIAVTQATASSLKAQVVAGDATGSAVPANGYYQGGNAITSLPTAATAGNLTGLSLDKFGRSVNLIGTIRDLRSTQTTTISASTSETTIITAGAAGVFNDVVAIIISNTSATAARVDIRDATSGSVIGSVYVPAGDVRGFALPGESIPQTTAANNWTAQSSASVTDLRVFAIFDKNK